VTPERDGAAAAHPLDEWVDGIRHRSNAAFRAVYGATADDLVSFANGMLRDRSAAEDAVQQAFLELVRSAARFRGDGRALRVWLFRSVRFTCLDSMRKASRRERPTERIPEAVVEDDPIEALPDPGLVEALDRLPKRQRTIVLLKHVVGMSGEEIARVMGMTRGAVYAAGERAERGLREMLSAVIDDG
jgi:RNA polymerase sigma-70 factor (ECF subfamily)